MILIQLMILFLLAHDADRLIYDCLILNVEYDFYTDKQIEQIIQFVSSSSRCTPAMLDDLFVFIARKNHVCQ